MPKIVNRNQQIKGFVWLAFSFMLIFLTLAGVITWNYSHSIYLNSDRVLNDSVAYYDRNGLLAGNTAKPKRPANNDRLPVPDDFRGNYLYYDSNQKQIVNETVGNDSRARNVVTKHLTLKLDPDLLGKSPKTIKVGNNYLRVQAITFKNQAVLVSNGNEMVYAKYAYVFVDATDTVLNLKHFQELISWSFALAGVVALLLAYLMSRQNMKPILKAWDQQQDFVNNAAHELRTPMSVIQGKLETMLTKPSSTVRDQSENIILSLSEVRRLNSLTDNMLTLAKTGSNMTKIEKEPTDITAFLKKIISPYVEMAAFDDKKVLLDVDVDQPVDVDRRRIHQLMVLLLDNALKYSDAESTVKVSATTERRRLILEVADTGRGISNEAKKHIFDRFYREDKSGNRETGGTGLGLSIAEWIVQAHGGRITVSDNHPRGTIFRVVLPL
ncbi:HAMP domain-containing sensor histidine kinase [Leuconostocaceae bacterium ESL0723]|nr:HAMP domain-containing sensor histidine kinase [Leuconostocaceae bacterium ESL0723]